ncbi:MAG TPA: NIPSNAP family containing protein [Candidatus Binatia bacterium]|jgi:hypothetical protein|nr:NIPSNAP family containing protein [Candidatus Binatia bacterium]
MPNSCLYLHELIDIVGTGSEPYKAHTGALGTDRADGGAPLIGTWQQSGSTGTWPLVVNLWEMRGWDHWAEILEKQYTRASGQEPKLATWWKEATKYRSGGFDRILEPAPWSPTRQELVDAGVRGMACLQEIATVRPGTAEDYLEAVAKHWRATAAKRGLTLLGAWRTTMRDTEAVLLWSLPGFAELTQHLGGVERSREGRRWQERARTWRIDYRETLLVPSVWCITHPDWQPASRRARRR